MAAAYLFHPFCRKHVTFLSFATVHCALLPPPSPVPPSCAVRSAAILSFLSLLFLLGLPHSPQMHARTTRPYHSKHHLTPPIEVVAMAFMVSSLIGALPKAHAFVGAGVRSLPKQSASVARWGFVTTATTATAANTPIAFARRSPGVLGRYWAGGAVAAIQRQAATPLPATASLTRGLKGSPPMFASAGGVMETAAVEGAKHVLVPVADGSEEIESVTIIDTLVRAGAVVTVASVGDDIEVYTYV